MKKSSAEHLGKKIKKIRSFNGMTQDELAVAINKTRSMVSHIERTGEVNYYTLREIAKVLKLPVEKLQEEDNMEALILNEPGNNYKTSDQELILQLREEITFLKDTIQNQWKLLFELSK